MPAVLFVAHQVLQHLVMIKVPLADNYLDPFCFSAIILVTYEYERGKWIGHEPLLIFETIAWVIVLSVVSELLFPLLSSSFTSDWCDALAIAFGGLWFYLAKRDQSAL